MNASTFLYHSTGIFKIWGSPIKVLVHERNKNTILTILEEMSNLCFNNYTITSNRYLIIIYCINQLLNQVNLTPIDNLHFISLTYNFYNFPRILTISKSISPDISAFMISPEELNLISKHYDSYMSMVSHLHSINSAVYYFNFIKFLAVNNTLLFLLQPVEDKCFFKKFYHRFIAK